MRVESDEPCPLPEDAILAQFSRALADGRHWGQVFDTEWRLVYMTDDMRLSLGGSGVMIPILVDEHIFGPQMVGMYDEWPFAPPAAAGFSARGAALLADCSGDRDRLKAKIDSSLHHLVDQLNPLPDNIEIWSSTVEGRGFDTTTAVTQTVMRVRDRNGVLRGNAIIYKPAAGMYAISALVVQHDHDHLKRMQQVISAERRPTAILFADLEASSALARRLSTSQYFGFNRRLVRAVDDAVIQAGGLVGRHVGDGVVAFFPAVTFDSESEAARACIQAARSIRSAMEIVAERSDMEQADAVMRFGLHWGSTPYIGGITTGARTEVTALGDEVNEAARIEACATGGRILASKQLVERLNRSDAAAVDVETGHVNYTQLSDLDSATAKARRDAPSIAVCEL